MRRFILGYLDLRAQLVLFLAQVRAEDAARVVADAHVEMDRALKVLRHCSGALVRADEDAKLAAMQVRRYRQRAAVGLR